uniref:Uncharacterized protein n=1 Tax=Tanacetum cinerariifolium TaxID=118510 RepID=A0A6L2MNU3_TANCI|nr:hypothetical protein [Tanacetum cinerariifolium]
MSFLRELGHTGEINSLNDVVVDHIHQHWSTFAALINKSLSGKTTGLDKLRLSRAQILLDKTLSWRNKIGMHTYRDDYLINTFRFVSAKEETQIYCAILHKYLTSPEMKETQAYKTYLVSIEEPTGMSKRVKIHLKKSTEAPARGGVIRETPEMPLTKKKEKVDVTREDEDDEEEVKDEFEKTPSNDSNDEDETMITDKVEVDTDKGFVQEECTDAAMTNVQQGNENPEILQVIEDAHVTLSIVPQKTEVPDTNSSYSSDLAAKFLNFLDIPHTDAEIVSPLDVHVHHEAPSQQTPTLVTVPISIIFDSSPVFSTVIPQSLPSFTPLPQ